MSSTAQPPAYGAPEPEPPRPPAYTPPTTYAVGHKTLTAPLVTPAGLITHLRLLGAFWALRQQVEAGDARFPAQAQEMEQEQRWGWFVALAVER